MFPFHPNSKCEGVLSLTYDGRPTTRCKLSCPSTNPLKPCLCNREGVTGREKKTVSACVAFSSEIHYRLHAQHRQQKLDSSR